MSLLVNEKEEIEIKQHTRELLIPILEKTLLSKFSNYGFELWYPTQEKFYGNEWKRDIFFEVTSETILKNQIHHIHLFQHRGFPSDGTSVTDRYIQEEMYFNETNFKFLHQLIGELFTEKVISSPSTKRTLIESDFFKNHKQTTQWKIYDPKRIQ